MGEKEQSKEDLSYASLRFSLASTPPGIDRGGGCCPVCEEEQTKEDLSYTSLGFSLASALPGFRRRWRLLPGG